jgi:hypothetical protein
MKKSKLDMLMESLLKEDQPVPPPTNTQEFAPVEAPKDVSLDQVIDRYLIRYEKESIPTVDDYESELYDEAVDHSQVLEYVFKEAPEDEELPDEGGDDELDLGGDEGGEDLEAGGDDLDLGLGEEDPDAGPGATGGEGEGGPAVVATPQINLNDFARSVARMVNNYETLLNPRETIINRVEAYITSNYDERTARELMDILDTNYSLRTSEEQSEQEDNAVVQTPHAMGALSTDG